jgi:hypothetical protein
MPACDMGFEHDEAVPVPEPEPVVVDPGPNENDVKIAEIEAGASIEREKIWTEQRGLDLIAEVEQQRGEIKGMREVLDRVAPAPPDPEQEAAPEIVPVPEATPPAEPVAAPPETESKPKEKKNAGWWDGYQ